MNKEGWNYLFIVAICLVLFGVPLLGLYLRNEFLREWGYQQQALYQEDEARIEHMRQINYIPNCSKALDISHTLKEDTVYCDRGYGIVNWNSRSDISKLRYKGNLTIQAASGEIMEYCETTSNNGRAEICYGKIYEIGNT